MVACVCWVSSILLHFFNTLNKVNFVVDIKRTCRITGAHFLVTQAEQDILRRIGEFNPAIGKSLPLPSVHPFENIRQIYSFSAHMYLHRSKSALSGVPQLSMFDTERGYRICTIDEFWSDSVDNIEFGVPFDFNRSLAEQWGSLLHRVYLPPLNITNVEGSDYVTSARNVKNCYLCFAINDSQDCLYCMHHNNGNDNLYCIGAKYCQYCFGCLDVERCYSCQHLQDCQDCSSCFGCSDCADCHDCIGCAGLRHARNCLFNSGVSKEKVDAFRAENDFAEQKARRELLARCEEFIAAQNHQTQYNINAEECSGIYIVNSRNLLQCYHASGSEDCGYLLVGNDSRDCWRGYGVRSELCYQAGPIHTTGLVYASRVWGGENNVYSHLLYNCSNCFGCIGLVRKSYCVLNRQYKREEYFEIVPRIIAQMSANGEWGEFLSPKYAPLYYEESLGPDLIESVSDAELSRRGYCTRPAVQQGAVGEIDSSSLPEHIDQVDVGELAGRSVAGAASGQAFRYQRKELEFYKKHRIALPLQHWRINLQEMLHKRTLLPAVKRAGKEN
jgi:hypothetical protein